MTADVYVKLDYNNEDEKKLRDAAQLFRNVAECIGKCTSAYELYKPFIDAAERMEEILDNYGIVD